MRLILVRHGQTASNVGNHLDTAEPGADLTDLGRQQAAALPAALAGERVEALYASTLVRTQQTAAPLAEATGLPVVVRAGLREISAGDLEMANDADSIRRYVTTVVGWADGAPHVRMPGGESGREVLSRFDAVVAEVLDLGVGTAVLVSHGAIIRAWVAARSGNVTAAQVARHPVSNTGAVVLERSARRWEAVSWEGRALGGPGLTSAADGPAAETLDLR